ncbi:iron-sulfur cluster biosynthesis family protein [Peribacillus deserti]|uniref:Heme biosynthesis protein HemY n=1 Tax=Peribacillus deserti TaxID=673318 RepID=A0A2N5M1I9_9BACI|nr:iron-sulfur cluster biosynthesis family protein [Peribacillus deserti]PLT28254.1 heme biosynthesis protein HemY [Peribacillus deserti]
MQIEWTTEAQNKLAEKMRGRSGFLKLKYDTEGCGCVVSGVTALWLESDLTTGEEVVITNAGPLYIEKSKTIFLDDRMKISYIEDSNCFRLASPSQIINPRLNFFDYTS